MKAAEKYKQTEVGLIPSDWEVKEFGDLTEKIIGGGTPSRSNKLFWGNEIPWVTVKDFATFHSFQTQEYITKDGLNNSASHLIPKGIIITSTRMALGKAVIYDVDVSINQDLKAIFPKKKIDTKFFYYWFQFNSKYIEDLGSGSTVMGLSLTDLRKIKIKLPPTKAEQTAIATALSDADALISSLSTLIAKKRNIKQGAMQKLLQPNPDSHREGWEVKRLGEVIINFQNGYGFSAIGYVKSGIPIITMAQIGLDGSFNFDEAKVNFWKPEDFWMLKSFHIKNGDLIIAMTDVTPEKNLIGRMAIVKTKHILLLNQRVGLLRLDATKVNAYYLKTLSNMRSWRTYCIGSASLGVQANLGTKDILSGEISLPKIEEQNKIATILSDMDAEISALETKLEKYRKVKLGMMQNLLTGKIRLV